MDTGDRQETAGKPRVRESKKDDCGLTLRFCPASCFGVAGKRQVFLGTMGSYIGKGGMGELSHRKHRSGVAGSSVDGIYVQHNKLFIKFKYCK